MILPVLVSLLAAGGLLLRGAWDLWAQALLQLAVAAGTSLWLAARMLIGYIPLPSRRNLLWAGSLGLLSALSARASPVSGLSVPEWHNFLCALWVFPALTAVSKDERFYIDEAIRAAAWVLMMLACYQHWGLGEERPASALVNPNVYAGAALMLLPLALEKRDWLLAGGLALNLWWCKSVGAWLGLFAALALNGRMHRGRWSWPGVAGCLVCLVAIYNKFQSPEVLNRWEWWKAAAGMALERPHLGFGPGSFAYVLPATRAGGPLGTLYAHQYFLQTAAEYGLLFSLIWFSGIWHTLGKGRSYKRFGVLAVLIHSLWDWPLSMPANLWLFAYLAASSLSEEPDGVNVPLRWKLPAAAAALGLGVLVCGRVWNLWAGDRDRAAAVLLAESGRLEEARVVAESAAARLKRDPESRLVLARIQVQAGDLRGAASSLERAATLNPYRARTWAELVSAYEALGDSPAAAQALARGSRRHPRLKDLLRHAR